MNVSSIFDRVRQRKRRLLDRLDRDNFPEGDGPVMRASNIHYELAERTLATNYGGIGLMYQLARESGLIDAIDTHLDLFRVHLPYHESDHVLNIAYNALCDARAWKTWNCDVRTKPTSTPWAPAYSRPHHSGRFLSSLSAAHWLPCTERSTSAAEGGRDNRLVFRTSNDRW